MCITKKSLTKISANTYYFKIDVYFTEYFLAVEIDEQNHEGRELIFEKKKKKQEALKKSLVANLLELIQVMQKRVMIQISKLARYKYLIVNLKKKNKRKTQQNKRTRSRNKKIKTSINKSKCTTSQKMF